ncbi:hypothetical protein [uncultured Methanospirillum sp.]|uniref:hypothetical protein n=1 Tax=uncultured Methanospirillum sp. TaxID=262503 RepID=UPI003747AC82
MVKLVHDLNPEVILADTMYEKSLPFESMRYQRDILCLCPELAEKEYVGIIPK